MPRHSDSIPTSRRRLISSLALLAVVAGGLGVAAVRKTHSLLKIGTDDHIHCAISGAYPRQAGRAEMIDALGPYSVMLQPVLDQMPGDPVVSAHRCNVNGRAYVHMIVRRRDTFISVILTRRSETEKFPPSLHRAGIPVHEGNLDGYAVAGFEAGAYLGYVASALPGAENEALAVKLAPVIRRYTGA